MEQFEGREGISEPQDLGEQESLEGAASRQGGEPVESREGGDDLGGAEVVSDRTGLEAPGGGAVQPDGDAGLDESDEPTEPDSSPRRLLGGRGVRGSRPRTRRRVRATDAVGRRQLTASQRMLILDSWMRSKLPAGDFASIAGVSPHTLYGWRKRFEEQGPAGLASPQHRRGGGSRLPGALHARQVRDLRPEAYEHHRQRLLRQGLAPATVNTGLIALNGMLRWAVATRRIAENPMESLRVLPTGRAHQKRPRRALTEQETEAFLQAAYGADEAAAERFAAVRTIGGGTRGAAYAARERPERVPQGPLFRFLIETGSRWGEARQVTWADLDLTRCRMTLRPATTKNRRGRVLPLKRSLVDELQRLVAVHHRVLGRAPCKDDSVFLTARGKPWPADTGNVRRLLRPILKAAGIEPKNERGEHVDVHSLRHTTATRLARAGWPMAKLQRFMGHADPRTTQRYYDHLEVEDLEAAFDLVPDLTPAVAAESRAISGSKLAMAPGGAATS